jgi:RNA recognition motif-containing protein
MIRIQLLRFDWLKSRILITKQRYFFRMNIYVGNLSYQADEQSLGDLFAAFGEVRSVRVITDRETGRPRGFGFVEMSSAEEGQNAISALNGQEHLGRQLNINEAQPRQDRGGFRGGNGGGGDRRSFNNNRY